MSLLFKLIIQFKLFYMGYFIRILYKNLVAVSSIWRFRLFLSVFSIISVLFKPFLYRLTYPPSPYFFSFCKTVLPLVKFRRVCLLYPRRFRAARHGAPRLLTQSPHGKPPRKKPHNTHYYPIRRTIDR